LASTAWHWRPAQSFTRPEKQTPAQGQGLQRGTPVSLRPKHRRAQIATTGLGAQSRYFNPQPDLDRGALVRRQLGASVFSTRISIGLFGPIRQCNTGRDGKVRAQVPLHRRGWGVKRWSGSRRPTRLQRRACRIVIGAAKRRGREDSQIDQRRWGVSGTQMRHQSECFTRSNA
jgi:hypothetical protein